MLVYCDLLMHLDWVVGLGTRCQHMLLQCIGKFDASPNTNTYYSCAIEDVVLKQYTKYWSHIFHQFYLLKCKIE